jgi:hypothetical protein
MAPVRFRAGPANSVLKVGGDISSLRGLAQRIATLGGNPGDGLNRRPR